MIRGATVLVLPRGSAGNCWQLPVWLDVCGSFSFYASVFRNRPGIGGGNLVFFARISKNDSSSHKPAVATPWKGSSQLSRRNR